MQIGWLMLKNIPLRSVIQYWYVKEKRNKWSTRLDPKPYCVTRVKGTMITATRPGHYITRNSSFYKKVPQQELQQRSETEEDRKFYSELDTIFYSK